MTYKFKLNPFFLVRIISFADPSKTAKTVGDAARVQRPILSAPVAIQPENILKQTKGGHSLVMVKRKRVKGHCVECIKQKNDPLYKKSMNKIITHCPQCPGGVWICEPCFDRTHASL